jgi:flagellar assembly protein FliH
MSSEYIPKEKLTAYERWELAAFDEAERLAQTMRAAEAAAEQAAAAPEPEPPPAPAISEEELAAIRAAAAEEGRQAGFAEGLQRGFAEGLARGEAAAGEERARIRQTAEGFSAALLDREAAVAEDTLRLALDIARQVIRGSLNARPELILPVVREAMEALTSQHGHPTLVLNPEDAALVRPQLDDQLAHTGWRIVEDPTLSRGGCRVESAGAEIDATLQERWRRVVETLGQDPRWANPD